MNLPWPCPQGSHYLAGPMLMPVGSALGTSVWVFKASSTKTYDRKQQPLSLFLTPLSHCPETTSSPRNLDLIAVTPQSSNFSRVLLPGLAALCSCRLCCLLPAPILPVCPAVRGR